MNKHISTRLACIIATVSSVSAATVNWDADTAAPGPQDGGGLWDTLSTNWWNGAGNPVWTNGGDVAQFGATNGAAGVIFLGEAITAGGLVFTNAGSGSYSLDGTNTLTLVAPATNLPAAIFVAPGVEAIVGGNLIATATNSYKRGLGTLTLTGRVITTGRECHLDGGTVNFSGTVFNATKFLVGSTYAGPATVLNWQGGIGSVTNNFLGIGDNGSGMMNLLGGSFNANNSGGIFIGNNANYTGVLNVAGGALVCVQGPLWIGASYDGNQTTQPTWGYLNMSNGTFTFSGSKIQLTGTRTGHTAVVNLNGGTFNLNGAPITNGLGSSAFNFDGGTLRLIANNPNVLTVQRANVRNGGAIFDVASGLGATVAQALEHSNIGGDNSVDGGLIKRGTNATLTLTGSNSYNGGTFVQAGTLQLGGGGTGGTVGTGDVIISNNAQFVFRRSDAIVFSNKITGLGTGGVLLQSTGTVTITGTNNVWGLTYPQSGTLEFDLGGGTFTGTGKFSMNGNSNAAVNWKSGTGNLATGDFITFADNISGTSTLNVVGGTLNFLNTGNRVLVGNQYVAIVHVSGGTLNIGNGGSSKVPLILGGDIQWDQSNASGTLNLSDTGVVNVAGGSTFLLGVNTNAGVKTNATGTVNLDGGTLSVARDIARGSGNGYFNFNGGRLVITTNSPTFMQGLSRANVRNGGADITLTGTATIAQSLLHSDVPGDAVVDGGLVKRGPGTLTLTGTNAYGGPTRILAGTLALANDGSLSGSAVMLLASNATLSVTGRTDATLSVMIQELTGDGTVQGSVTNSGILSPGSQVGTLTITGDLGLSPSSQVKIELGGATVTGVDYDLLTVNGSAALDGTLTVLFTNGYTGAANDSFLVFNAGSATGGFATTNLPALAPGLSWNVQWLGGALLLSISSSTTPGGYDVWALQITNAADRSYAGDADADGYANLLEYATAGSPTNADTTARMNGVRTNGVLALQFNRATNAADVTFFVEGADAAADATVWQVVAVNSNGVWTSGTVVEAGGPNPVAVTAFDTVPAATNRFLRLRVMRP